MHVLSDEFDPTSPYQTYCVQVLQWDNMHQTVPYAQASNAAAGVPKM
jgi:hypothetical protein